MLCSGRTRRQTGRAERSRRVRAAEGVGADNRDVGGKRRKRAKQTDPLAAYKRIRKPMPPPEKVIPDKRRKLEEEESQRGSSEDP